MQEPPPDSKITLTKLYSEAIRSEFTDCLNKLNGDIIGKQIKAIISMNQDSITQLHYILNICERSEYSEQFLTYNISVIVKLRDIQNQSHLMTHSQAKPHDKYNFHLGIAHMLLKLLNEVLIKYEGKINIQEIYNEIVL